MAHQGEHRAVDQASPRIPLWGEVGATLARLGAPLDLGFQDEFEPLVQELPLKGGRGRAPLDIEAKRQAAALVRQLYDDVFAYLDDSPADEVIEPPAPEETSTPPPDAAAPVEVQAFDRKTGQPIKVRINMQSPPQAG